MNNKPKLTILYCTIVLISLLFVTGCGTSTLRPERDVVSQEARAKTLLKQQKFSQAAELYLNIATQVSNAKKASYLMHATEILILAGDYLQAQTTLTRVDKATLNPEQLIRYQLASLASHVYLAQFQAAEQVIQGINQARLNTRQSQQYLTYSLELYAATNDYLSALGAYVDLTDYPLSTNAKQHNQTRLWESLHQLSNDDINILQTNTDPIITAWAELIKINQNTYENKQQLQQAIAQWQTKHPQQQITQKLITQIIASYSSYFIAPKKIAVLLPMTGRYKQISKLIYAGITAAEQLNENLDYAPEITLYDTSDNPAAIMTHYQAAVDDGAEYIIGPLSKEAVEHIAQQQELSLPTLTLNYLPDHTNTPKNLYQYGLLPEDEASQVADLMIKRDHKHALILSPQGNWETRLITAFSQHFEEGEDRTLDIQYYEKNKVDFSGPLKQALLINQSESRHKELSAIVGKKLKYQPRRRQDIDAIFLIARPELARLMRPQINYQYATELPVYSTSHIFSGTENITKDRDINDVIFCDMPWIIDPQIEDDIARELIEIEAGNGYQDLPRFAAMGIDAYHLPLQIHTLQIRPNSSFQGVTGNLRLTNNNHIFRQLSWSKFRNGRPRLIQTP